MNMRLDDESYVVERLRKHFPDLPEDWQRA